MDWKLVEFVYFDYSLHILWRKLMFTSSRAHLSKLYQLMKATMQRRERTKEKKRTARPRTAHKYSLDVTWK